MIWLYIFIAVETVSVFLCMARWSKRYLAGTYRLTGTPDAAEAWWGHLAMGLVPIFGFAYVFGSWQHKRELEAAAKAKEIENAQKDVLRLVQKDS